MVVNGPTSNHNRFACVNGISLIITGIVKQLFKLSRGPCDTLIRYEEQRGLVTKA